MGESLEWCRATYNHGRRGSRSGTRPACVIHEDSLEESRGRHYGGFRCIATADGAFYSGEGAELEHVGPDGSEDDIQGQLCKAALCSGSKDRVRLLDELALPK